MSFLSSDLFSFVTDRSLKSKFRGLKDLAKLLEIDVDQNSMENINPDELFAKLIQSPIELDLIKVFALMGWDNSDWKTQHGQYAMKNWWLSALNQEKQHGEAQLLLVMTLRAILADTERYPAPKDVVQVMGQVLLKLIKEGYFKGQDHIEILEALITEDSKKLASIAILQGKTVTELMHRLWVPQKLPTVQHANLQWLNLWVQSNSQQRKLLRQPLNALLHSHLGVEQQYQFAQIIFSHTSFSKQISALEKEVKNYPELVAWLSSCARQIEFKTQLTTDERQQLNCWIGTGNYESLYEILMQIAQSTED